MVKLRTHLTQYHKRQLMAAIKLQSGGTTEPRYTGSLQGVFACNHLSLTRCRALRNDDMGHAAANESCGIPHGD